MPPRSCLLHPLLLAATTQVLTACGGTDHDQREPEPPTFTELYETIFARSCTAVGHCHSSNVATGFLSFASRDEAYVTLVNEDAKGFHCGSRGLRLVVPAVPEESLLLAKLEGTADCGAQMPSADSPLPASDIAAIRAWIRSGAPDD